MPTTTTVHADILDALTTAGLYAAYGPARDLPKGADGRVAQAAVLWPSAGLHAYTRMIGTRSGRVDRVTVTCVGSSTQDALAVADKVEAAIGGMVLSDKGGTLRQVLATQPAPEPNADPQRVSLAVEYATITKG